MTTAERETGLETALLYHEETKHHLHRYARSLGYLAWEDQPNPFREFQGASRTDQRVELPLAREEEPLPFTELFSGQPASAQDLSLRTLGRFFELSLALSAWKEIPGHRWALRINPSSGNLHPTEAYALLPAMEGLGSRGGAYHYLSRDHALELRSRWDCPETVNVNAGFYVAFTSVPWRESWRYGGARFPLLPARSRARPGSTEFFRRNARLEGAAPNRGAGITWYGCSDLSRRRIHWSPRFPRPWSGFRRLQRRPRLHCPRLNLRWSASANPISLAQDIIPGL